MKTVSTHDRFLWTRLTFPSKSLNTYYLAAINGLVKKRINKEMAAGQLQFPLQIHFLYHHQASFLSSFHLGLQLTFRFHDLCLLISIWKRIIKWRILKSSMKKNYNSKREDLEEEDQGEDERNVILKGVCWKGKRRIVKVLIEYRISSKDWIKEKCIRMKISQDH